MVVVSKCWKSQIAITSGGSVNASAVCLMSACARDGRQRITAMPASGMKVINVSA